MGYYTGPQSSALSCIEDLNTSIPGGTGNFTSFSTRGADKDGSQIASRQRLKHARGRLSSQLAGGRHPYCGQDLRVSVRLGQFHELLSVDPQRAGISGNTVSFYATGSGSQQGIFRGDGTAGVGTVVSSTLTTYPGGGAVVNVGFGPSMVGNSVAFLMADATKAGLFTSTGTGGTGPFVGPFASNTTPIPGGTGNFTSWGASVTQSAGSLAFYASGSGGQHGVYRSDGTTVIRIADTSMAMPGFASGNFQDFFQEVGLVGNRTVISASITPSCKRVSTTRTSVAASSKLWRRVTRSSTAW